MSDALQFLIASVFSLVLYLFVLRFLLVFGQISYQHPLVQTIDKFTRPVIAPLRRFIPKVGRIESASLMVILAVKLLQIALYCLMTTGTLPWVPLIVYSLSGTLQLIAKAFFFAVLAHIILSWVQPRGPAIELLTNIIEPLMQPVRRIIPPLGGIDVTPIPVLIGLQFLILLLP